MKIKDAYITVHVFEKGWQDIYSIGNEVEER